MDTSKSSVRTGCSSSLSDSFKTQNKIIILGTTVLHVLLSSLEGTIKSLLVKQEYTKKG